MYRNPLWSSACVGAILFAAAQARAQDASLGGFIPFVGMSMTNEFKTFDDIDLGETFFISDAEPALNLEPGKQQLGAGGNAHYELALLDTGAATHILSSAAYEAFDIEGFDLEGTNTQAVGGATGTLNMSINDAAGVYIAGVGHRDTGQSDLAIDVNALRGQSSFATLSAPTEWRLPSIVGLPMAMHHSIVIRNDDPQIFTLDGRTVRTPQIDLIAVGDGGDQGIQRRAALNIRPGIGFAQGPFYVYNLDINDILLGGALELHNNPSSPTVVQDQTGTGGSLFLDIDLQRDGIVKQEREFLFDTGADITVISEHMAKRLGFDAVLDTPDFVLEVEGSGGISGGVPGIYVDELNIVTVGGDFKATNVPVAVLDVTDISDPGNVLDGIIGTHLFNGRNLVIDAKPSLGGGGAGPSLYISDPVTSEHIWSSSAATGDWSADGNWTGGGSPSKLWVARAVAAQQAQTATVSSDSTVFELSVSGGAPAETMTVDIQNNATLTVFGGAKIDAGGEIRLSGGKIDAQNINIEDDGVLTGFGDIFVGTGPISGAVRNIAGRIAPGDAQTPVGDLAIEGDLANLESATLAFDLGGTSTSDYDQIQVDRFAFLDGIIEVSLADLGGGVFAPASGNSFTLITAGDAVVGQFDQLLLPAGFQWDVDYLANSVVLQVLNTIEILDGDFNSDGGVNDGDLSTWATGFGVTYDGDDFLTWQRNYGAGGLNAANVPEPSTAFLAALIVLTALVGRSSVFRTFRA